METVYNRFSSVAHVVDVHAHVLEPTSLLEYIKCGKKSVFFRLAMKKFQQENASLSEEVFEAHNESTVRAVDESLVDFAVALALDRPYLEDGRNPGNFVGFSCSNNFTHNLCRTSQKLLFGASVHPYRSDALDELERVIANGACLIKWLPSAQNIDPAHPKCRAFYEILRRENIPLLSHSGPEHFLRGFGQTLNDPRRLTPALEQGVKVIAAHCGARLMLHERSYFRAWCEMARKYENFFGDISALVTMTRGGILATLAKDEVLNQKLVYGSDFPSPPGLWSCVHLFKPAKVRELEREGNLFSRSVLACKALGVTDEVFSRGARLLRLETSVGVA